MSSKVFWGGDLPTQSGLSKKHIHDACNAALKRLQVEYLDLYFCHRPDVETPIEETVRAMSNLVQQGKVLYWGTSEWDAQQITEAHMVARELNLTPPTMEQPQYNIFERQKVEVDYEPLYSIGLGTTIWSPLASGILSGKYEKGIPSDSRMNQPGYEWLKARAESADGKEKISKATALAGLAREIGAEPAQLAIAWCLANPHVSSVILGASKREQLITNLGTLSVLNKMTPEVLRKIETIAGTKPTPRPNYL